MILPILICLLDEGSYGPIVLAGATFGIWTGWGIGYVAMNGGAMLNVLLVRYALQVRGRHHHLFIASQHPFG